MKITAKIVNVIDADEVALWLGDGMNLLGKLDGAINLAAIPGALGMKPMIESSNAGWDSVVDVNVKGVFNCLKAEIPRMNQSGSIVNISSLAGLRGVEDSAPCCTSKIR